MAKANRSAVASRIRVCALVMQWDVEGAHVEERLLIIGYITLRPQGAAASFEAAAISWIDLTHPCFSCSCAVAKRQEIVCFYYTR